MLSSKILSLIPKPATGHDRKPIPSSQYPSIERNFFRIPPTRRGAHEWEIVKLQTQANMHHISEDRARHYVKTSVYKPRHFGLSVNNLAVRSYRYGAI